ncbi:hypothetical protein [Paenibacillus fonticola]|uniref:hypothetical protein n=1 Tax=Paenibacillus fonticola TaxID=379896 RepID=UPI00036D4466|nr:hypothetical protein [Paenibacillus fonticola]
MSKILKSFSVVFAAVLIFGLLGGHTYAASAAKSAKKEVKPQYVTYQSNGSVLKLKKNYKGEVALSELYKPAIEIFNIYGGYFTSNQDKNIENFNRYVDKSIPTAAGFDREQSKKDYVQRHAGSLDNASEAALAKLSKELKSINAKSKINATLGMTQDGAVEATFSYKTQIDGSEKELLVILTFEELNDSMYALSHIRTTN